MQKLCHVLQEEEMLRRRKRSKSQIRDAMYSVPLRLQIWTIDADGA